MNDNDISDEAYLKWIRGRKHVFPRDVADEWCRRCEARLIIEKKKLEEQMEQRERKAFIAGYYHPGTPDFEDAWREFKEGKCE